MIHARHRAVARTFGLVLAAWLVAETLSGNETGLLYLVPALVLALPLLLGRYVGEEQLAELAGRRTARPRPRLLVRVAATRSRVRVMYRGGRLLASAMAKRPPPVVAPPPAAA